MCFFWGSTVLSRLMCTVWFFLSYLLSYNFNVALYLQMFVFDFSCNEWFPDSSLRRETSSRWQNSSACITTKRTPARPNPIAWPEGSYPSPSSQTLPWSWHWTMHVLLAGTLLTQISLTLFLGSVEKIILYDYK